MSVAAELCFDSGKVHERSAPQAVDPEGRFVFGHNLPRMIDALDESARVLGVTEPSQFVWHNPLYDEGGLDKLSEKEFQELEEKCNAMAKWISIEQGIQTFHALAMNHKLQKMAPDESEPTDQAYYLAFEVACYLEALKEASSSGEKRFHIQIS